MKLYFSPASPYARKVMACAIACGIDGQITIVGTDPWVSPPDLVSNNPLSKIPTLVTEDGLALFDSPVICEYIDSIGAGGLFPPAGAARWRALKLQAIGDGILDASIIHRREGLRPDEAARAENMQRQVAIVTAALDLLEGETLANHLDIGTITVACALGYRDHRFVHEDWRVGRPRLAAWAATMAARPEISRTLPPA